MSDAAVATLVSGVVTIVTMLVGFLTLWVKLKYGVEKTKDVESKVDHNTALTTKIEQQTNGPLSDKLAALDVEVASKLENHGSRITALEAKMETMRTAIDSLNGNLNSTRHELRGHLQTITNSLHVLAIKGTPTPAEPSSTGK